MIASNPLQIQQGDVLARIVPALPEGSTRLTTKTVAEGSQTGHSHTFTGKGVSLWKAPNGVIFAANEGDQAEQLGHEEHGEVILQAGQIAEFGHVLEKDWFQDMVRQVID